MPLTDEEYAAQLELLARHVAALMEHFDTVQIFATRHDSDPENGGTLGYRKGAGNAFAREGQAREWVNRLETQAREQARREMDHD